jgi:hypothetical protein
MAVCAAALLAGAAPAAEAATQPAPSHHSAARALPGRARAAFGGVGGSLLNLLSALGSDVSSRYLASVRLVPGEQGAAVLAMQQRLSSLGYWLGTPSGVFDDATEQAVYALQKAAHLPTDGIVGPATEQALAAGVVPTPQPAQGYVIEVDLADDLVMFTSNGKLDYVLNTSTGGGYSYTEKGVTSLAVTPVGHFSIYSETDGLVVDPLGQLWRPKYFDAGFALHGDTYVPPVPVSHGCVRVSNEAIDWIWSNNIAPIGTAVWVY